MVDLEKVDSEMTESENTLEDGTLTVDEVYAAMAAPGVSASTQIALYRSILSSYAGGLSDKGYMAAFALDSPDTATQALEAYQAQTCRVIEAVEQFMFSDREDTSRFEAEMDKLMRMRGSKSRRASAVVDARGSRRRR